VKRSGVGGGELHPIDLTDLGKIKRIRDTVVSCRISPSSAARAAHSAKGMMHRLLPDFWVHTDCHTGRGKRGDGTAIRGRRVRRVVDQVRA